jgi:hypothetical protein
MDTPIATDVWDANYKGVWHLDELSGNNTDSTSNQRTAIVSGSPTVVTGKISNARNYVGSSDVSAITSISLNGLPYTATAWFYYPAPATNDGWWTLLRGVNNDHQIIIRNSDSHLGEYDNTGAGFRDTGYSAFTTGWHYLGVIADASNTNFYVDGIKVGSTINWKSNSEISYFGNYQGGNQNFGKVDELRISTTNRLPSWIKFEYYNMNSATNELSWGAQQQM